MKTKVYYADTDAGGVVYYANYYRYFEAARAALLRAHGRNNHDMLEWGVALPVIESHCKYKSPAHYEDLLEVEVGIGKVGGASVRFVYTIKRQETVLAEGYTVHACVNSETGRPQRIPPELDTILATEPG